VNHLTDDDLVLLYYGEDGARLVHAERHLQSCAHCARAYESLVRTLSAVTPPDVVEAPDDLAELRALLRGPSTPASSPSEVGAIALVWLAALVYPFSFQALYGSGRVAQDYAAGTLLVALTAAWACAGPFAATFALNRLTPDGFQRASSRLLVLGALMAAISPSAYLLVSRADTSLSLNLGLGSWAGALALSTLFASFRWPSHSYSTARFQYVHRISALVLTVFVLGHVVNQALAFVSVPAYDAMRSVMRVASRDPVMYTVIVAAVALQMATGAAMGLRRVRPGAVARNLQAVTGWYLAAFLLTHVFSGYLFTPPTQMTAAVAPAASQFNLLATERGAAQLPFLLLGVAAFLFHVGIYARLAALAYLAEASVRRLSYAAMFVGTTVVVTVGLALCGIHLIR
jgi:succinate dehydrogenase/fumarate reductase cytochrome b subunit